MPYANSFQKRDRDRERAKISRQNRRAALKGASGVDRFSVWLDAVLSRAELKSPGRYSTATSAAAILAEHLGVERSYISKLRSGTTPNIRRAFEIGVALRECGVSWCSGVFALRMRGCIAEELAVLDALDRRGLPRGWITEYLIAAPSMSDNSEGALVEFYRDRMCAAADAIGAQEVAAFSEWSDARSSSFGLLGAVHHLVNSKLDPVDVPDACSALVKMWVSREKG